METLAVAATPHVATPPSSADMGQAALSPPDEPRIARWPGAIRLVILLGGGAALWAGIGWLAFRILELS